ncbi:MAG TPA: TonB-dependent receptor [Cellvibrio sp.]|nr:TonB-dependent receptor [Cellvibrio sp.]
MKSSAVLLAFSILASGSPDVTSQTLEQKKIAAQKPATISDMEDVETLVVSGAAPETTELTHQFIKNTDADFMPGSRIEPADLLTAIPGVQVDSRTNYAQDTRISLRGFGARSAFGVRGIDLLVDGIPMSTPDGQGQLSSVMLDSISGVYVLRGPLSSLYGNSSGGVIALQTSAPEANKISIAASNGDKGLERYHLQGDWRYNKFALRGQFADTTVASDRPHSRAEREQIAVQGFYTADNNVDLIIKHERSDDPVLQDPLGLTPQQWELDPWQKNSIAETFNTRKSVTHEQTSISLREQQGATRWQTGLWQGERDVIQHLGFTGDAIAGSGGVVDIARDFAGANATFSHSVTLYSVPFELNIGAEIAQMEDHRRGFVNNEGIAGDMRRNESGEVNSRDLYSLIQLDPVTQLRLYAGARRTWLDVDVRDYFIVPGNPDDSGERDYREESHVFGASYEFVNDWSLFASIGRGYETPTLTEMAYKANETGLNTQLAAAINHQQQWGVSYQSMRNLQMSLTHFRIDTENEIVVDQSVGGRTSFRNAAETKREGVELFARGIVNDHWQWQASAQVMDADYSAGQWAGKQIPGVAREQYQLGVEWRPLASDLLQVNLLTQQRSRIFTADSNLVAAPAFHTLDLAIQGEYTWQSWGLDWWLKLANVDDREYVGSVVVNQSNGRAFEPAMGRNLMVGLKINYHFAK